MRDGASLFIQKFIQSPLQVGSLLPSSKTLALKMTEQIHWEHVKNVVELGAGTGVVTREIIQSMTPNTLFSLFEKDFDMRKRLKHSFSSVHIYQDALDLTNLCGEETIDAVFSGLPFANFNKQLRTRIIEEVHRALRIDGVLIAFQYSLQMKKMLEHYFRTVEVKFVPKNFPPAFVYVCVK